MQTVVSSRTAVSSRARRGIFPRDDAATTVNSHAEEAASAAVSKHEQPEGSLAHRLRLHEFCELPLQRHVVSHVELLDGGTRQTGKRGDQVEFSLGFIGRDFLSGKHISYDRATNCQRRVCLPVVINRLTQSNFFHECRYLLLRSRAVPSSFNNFSGNSTLEQTQVSDTSSRAAFARVSSSVRRVAFLLSQAICLGFLVACTPTPGTLSREPSIVIATETAPPRDLYDVLLKLKRAASEGQLLQPEFYDQSHLLHFFGARKVTWRSPPSIDSKVIDLYSFVWQASEGSTASANASLVGVLTRVTRGHVESATVRGNISPVGNPVSYEQVAAMFGEGRSPTIAGHPVPISPHGILLQGTHLRGNQTIEFDWSNKIEVRVAVFEFREDGTVVRFRLSVERKARP